MLIAPINKPFLAVAVLCVVSACTQSPPQCSDEETLNLVREIAFGKDYTPKELQQHVVFETPRAIAEDKNIQKLSCAATMVVANTYQLPISYASQLDDHNEHLVSLGNISRGDALHLLIALNQAVEKTRHPEEAQSAITEPTIEQTKPVPPQSQSTESVIPGHFQGDWGSDESCRLWRDNPEARMGAPSPGVNVTATDIHFAEGGCMLARVITATDSAFVGAFRCTGDDGATDTKLTERMFKLDAGKLSVGEEALIKCQ